MSLPFTSLDTLRAENCALSKFEATLDPDTQKEVYIFGFRCDKDQHAIGSALQIHYSADNRTLSLAQSAGTIVRAGFGFVNQLTTATAKTMASKIGETI